MSSPSKTLESIAQIISAQSATDTFELKNLLITGISQSSKDVEEGDIFIALPGEKLGMALELFLQIMQGQKRSQEFQFSSQIILVEAQAYSAHGFTVNPCVIYIALELRAQMVKRL